MVKRILLLEPIKDGHPIQNILSLAEAARRHSGVRLTFLVNPAVKEYLSQLDFRGRAEIEVISLAEDVVDGLTSNNKQPRKTFSILHAAEELAMLAGIDHIHLMTMDLFTLSAPVFLNVRRLHTWSGLLYCPAIHYKKVYRAPLTFRKQVIERIKHQMVMLLLANPQFRLLQVDDLGYAEFVGSPKVQLIPEHSQDVEGETMPVDLDPKWVGLPNRILCFGALSRRHGIFELCEALEQLDMEESGVGIVFAGNTLEFDRQRFRSALDRLSARRPNLHVQHLQRYIADTEVKWLFQRCSVVAMPYQNLVGSSSVLCWAARARRPVVSQAWGMIGRVVVENGLGVAVDTSDARAVAEGLQHAFAGGVFNTAKAQEFIERNSAANFADTYFDQLEAAAFNCN